MKEVALKTIPAQKIQTVLASQNCTIELHQKERGLFFSLSVDGKHIVDNVLAQDANPLIHRKYVSFAGNFVFMDTKGISDPDYTGLGQRYALLYLDAGEAAAL